MAVAAVVDLVDLVVVVGHQLVGLEVVLHVAAGDDVAIRVDETGLPSETADYVADIVVAARRAQRVVRARSGILQLVDRRVVIGNLLDDALERAKGVFRHLAVDHLVKFIGVAVVEELSQDRGMAGAAARRTDELRFGFSFALAGLRIALEALIALDAFAQVNRGLGAGEVIAAFQVLAALLAVGAGYARLETTHADASRSKAEAFSAGPVGKAAATDYPGRRSAVATAVVAAGLAAGQEAQTCARYGEH